MVASNVEAVLGWIGLSEGGFVVDKGGPTNHGITQHTYSAWLAHQGRPLRSVKLISLKEVQQILTDEYLTPIRFNDLPSGVDYCVADCSVNSGPHRAAVMLQQAIGMAPAECDGVIGVHTLTALADEDPVRVIATYCQDRLAFMRRLSNWNRNKNGWTTRVMGRQAGVQTDDIGVIDRATRLAKPNANPGVIDPPTVAAPAKANPANQVTGLIGLILNIIAGLFPPKPKA